ncbi:NAD(P)-binding domain-containing protein [Nocardioides sp. QY071]|uniref:NAD(P)-dependent oxidoreductase n=1 Tax=Nocardioides sp. QY071 TaxID=3044187 RepID=UPI00249B15B2|nr:NAD(P)-binding domain-containing protein [Nocardioides sp. QY071]WGY02871.1 NAD(P)-binding domain-containing protein [Nocardioides sp. QY071]
MTGSIDQAAPTPDGDSFDVAVLGCGNMGTAMVRALIEAGRRVAVWNRTPERAEALVADGAVALRDANDALASAPLAILVVTTGNDLPLLEAADPARLRSHTVLNMTSGTPAEARRLGEWARTHGVPYLDAAIGAYPEQLGQADTRITVAGEEKLFEAHRDIILEIAGASMHVGTDHGAANAIDAALTGAFYISSLTSFIEAAGFVREFGIAHDVLVDLSSYSLTVLEHQMKLALDRIAANDFTTDQATIDIYADAARVFSDALSATGSDAAMIRTATQVLQKAVDAGLGQQDIAAAATLRA